MLQGFSWVFFILIHTCKEKLRPKLSICNLANSPCTISGAVFRNHPEPGNLPKPPLAFLMVSAKQLKPPLTSNSSASSSLFLQKPVKHSDPHTRHYWSCKHKMQQLKLKFCRGCYHSLCLLWTRVKYFHFAVVEVFKQQELKGFCTCFFTVVYIA